MTEGFAADFFAMRRSLRGKIVSVNSAFASLAWFAVHLIRPAATSPHRRQGIYFLHFEQKTFNPWAWIQN